MRAHREKSNIAGNGLWERSRQAVIQIVVVKTPSQGNYIQSARVINLEGFGLQPHTKSLEELQAERVLLDFQEFDAQSRAHCQIQCTFILHSLDEVLRA